MSIFKNTVNKTKNPSHLTWVFKWYLQESNQGHTDFQSVALPTELRYQAFESGSKYNFKFRIYQQKSKKRYLFFYFLTFVA